MKKRILILLLLTISLLAAYANVHSFGPGTLLQPAASPAHKILLLPLDSRPPCRKFVIDAGRIGDTEIITPPADIRTTSTEEKLKVSMSWHLMVLSPNETSTPLDFREASA